MIDDASEGKRAVENDAQIGDVVYAPEDLEKFYKGEITAEELKATRKSGDSSGGEGEVDATPAAIAHAESVGVDISTIQGTGTDGRITKKDVEAAVAAQESAPS